MNDLRQSLGNIVNCCDGDEPKHDEEQDKLNLTVVSKTLRYKKTNLISGGVNEWGEEVWIDRNKVL